MNCQVRTVILVFFMHPDADRLCQRTVDDQAAGNGKQYRGQEPANWETKLTLPIPPNIFWPKIPAAIPPTGADHTMQRQTPSTSIDLQFFLLKLEAIHKETAAIARFQRPQRVHQVTAGTDCNRRPVRRYAQSRGHYVRPPEPPARHPPWPSGS